MYDLLLEGGTVVDPSTGLSGTQDVAVEGGSSRASPRISRRPSPPRPST